MAFVATRDAHGTMLRVTTVHELALAKYTVLGWEVSDIVAVAKDLESAGVKLEQYGFKEQDERGIWTAPDGTRVAWFKDPDGNVLSLTQF
jgi:predicted enzyme related to lactoylglutathione lyase